MAGRALVVWVLIALAETLHGNLRVRYLNRLVGDGRARQIGVSTGSTIILAIAWPWLERMLAFDITFGRWLFTAPWQRIGAESDLRRGRLLGLKMPFVLFAPPRAAMLCGLI
jgi:hypothetical protein